MGCYPHPSLVPRATASLPFFKQKKRTKIYISHIAYISTKEVYTDMCTQLKVHMFVYSPYYLYYNINFIMVTSKMLSNFAGLPNVPIHFFLKKNCIRTRRLPCNSLPMFLSVYKFLLIVGEICPLLT